MVDSVLKKSSRNVHDPIETLDQDLLGRHILAEIILNRLANHDVGVLGIYGGWGTGKTSILNLIIALNEQQSHPILEKPKLEYIDVWPYEISGDLALPILVRTRKLIGSSMVSNYSKSWRRVLGVLAQAGADIALRHALGLELSEVKNYVDNLKDVSPDSVNVRDLETLVDDIRGTQDAFYELVQLASNANNYRRIVFLIDNLDRCSPENVVRLLESVKNFLNALNCTWLFAMDSEVIASYIDRKYEGTRMDGNRYLDKIIPEHYHIPPISGRDRARLEQFLCNVQPAQQTGLPVIDLRKIPEIPEVLVPRRLLKTARKFYEAYTTASVRGSSAHPDLIFALILLYNSWPAFYEHFSSETIEHVQGILANFIGKERRSVEPILIPQKYLDDRSLNHYLNHCFLKETDAKRVYESLVASMIWLREVGLP